jgi:hypothetical protein
MPSTRGIERFGTKQEYVPGNERNQYFLLPLELARRHAGGGENMLRRRVETTSGTRNTPPLTAHHAAV